MIERIVTPRLADIVEAIERIRRVLDGITLEAFEQNWEKRWLVERGIEVISEASRDSVVKSGSYRQCSSSCLRSRRTRCAVETCARRSGVELFVSSS
jgi:hypothetical protein